ncbi:LysM peptidoglycan-binding domain-containing protein [Staphylococcus pseudintermedius]|uniref:LysM peptidoglycan-binding domain-containing protein n=9 Tax=Staphylococcus pseudintermedius TaxID=283734 RepID=A0A166MIF9_STAPS|nr:LysM peptidoglycan-binding domain-containing protein [Staphylococcus pseudintermedius]ADV04647.1 Autolysin precursor [Staphylococcus pseudintermedius HKU10-03]ADX77566.1 N-acetylmuramoyl-L-alanine amidase Sle1 [Staphylococcus pseudintermedius ED99]ANQ82882.1 N-acetylmuramoyl-L-alanine amidase [Staphylococcus pseudintermedius]ANQ89332.1 N-acetylmuramoyl-L-alanine amidase [Staphylococcus pseudintermedius]ANS90746.1 Autolysin precursor [Staphylococcus pseudintermedius]
MRKKFIAAVIGTTAAATALSAHADASTTYRVQPGDSLWAIATKYNITIAQLKQYNGLNSNLIFPNQVLKVSGGSSTSRTTTHHSSHSTTSSTVYTVRYGDTLSGIAARYGTTYQNIMKWNGLNNFLILPGQKLNVSGPSTTPSRSTAKKPAPKTSSRNASYYTVQPGDSLSLIASKYGTTYQHIMELNGLTSFLIFPGQQLKVSGSAPSRQTTPTPSPSYQSPTFNHQNLYDWGQCTWYVFNKRKEMGRPISTYWWNANAWDDNAARDGYTINNQPAVGSILQSDLGYYGHVSYVERINADGSILVSEMNFTAAPGILTYRTVPAHRVSAFKYIH